MNKDMMDAEQEAQLDEALRAFRQAVHSAAANPEAYWVRQHASILDRAGRGSRSLWRPLLAWSSGGALVLILAGFLLDRVQAVPAPDFAAGYDQDLLAEVERLASAEVPLALEPAMPFTGDTERAGRESRPEVGPKAGAGR